jgi:hypothetical protein
MLPRVLLLVVVIFSGVVSAAEPPGRLRVSENGRHLVQADGKPFFYLGDTAWELFHRLNREDTLHYLDDRARKGFNVIEAVALAEFGGLVEPNAYANLPLVGNDPTKPLERYFEHVDFVVKAAAERGMYVGLLPTWGDKVTKKWGQGPEIFTPENARIYGEWLGRRYREQPIIWILGGDRPVETETHRAIWRAMAAGLRAGDGGTHLITYHPSGGRSSAEYVHQETWLDFNQIQSGHALKNKPGWKMIAADYARTPVKPCMDGEPAYEDHPVRSDKTKSDWFDEWDVRKLCYWDLFAGACGHTYGAHPIWGMWDGRGKATADQRHTWRDALDLLGSKQVGYARRLIESRPMLTRIPDQTLLASGEGDDADHRQATRDEAGTCAMIYTPNGKPFALNLTKFAAPQLLVWWWDPRTGLARSMGAAQRGERVEFTPPRTGVSIDWVLVLDDPAQKYPEPGSVRFGR